MKRLLNHHCSRVDVLAFFRLTTNLNNMGFLFERGLATGFLCLVSAVRLTPSRRVLRELCNNLY